MVERMKTKSGCEIEVEIETLDRTIYLFVDAEPAVQYDSEAASTRLSIDEAKQIAEWLTTAVSKLEEWEAEGHVHTLGSCCPIHDHHAIPHKDCVLR